MKYYLIDYENTGAGGFAGCNRLGNEDIIIIFFTKNANKIDMSVIADHGGAQLQMIEIPAGKQSADIHIGSFIGYLSAENKGQVFEIVIVSKDRDFDNVLKFWREKTGMKLYRAPQIRPSAAAPVQDKASENTSAADETSAVETDYSVIAEENASEASGKSGRGRRSSRGRRGRGRRSSDGMNEPNGESAEKQENELPPETPELTIENKAAEENPAEIPGLAPENKAAEEKPEDTPERKPEDIPETVSEAIPETEPDKKPKTKSKTKSKTKPETDPKTDLKTEPEMKAPAKPAGEQDITVLNNNIMKVLSKAGFPAETVGSTASLVVKNYGTQNAKQHIYRTIISKFGQKEGLAVYSQIKKMI